MKVPGTSSESLGGGGQDPIWLKDLGKILPLSRSQFSHLHRERFSPLALISKVREPDKNLGPHVQTLEGSYFLDNSDPGDP